MKIINRKKFIIKTIESCFDVEAPEIRAARILKIWDIREDELNINGVDGVDLCTTRNAFRDLNLGLIKLKMIKRK